AVIHIDVPPLRKRQEDIISILKHLIPGVAIDSESMAILCDYGWPGNIRELKNFTERIKVLGTDIISAEDLPGRLGDAETVEVDSDLPLPDKLKAYEKEHIEHALQSCNGSRNKAAKQLGISRQALQYKLEKYGMDNA
ncbi:MAG: sigma-54-dependent Fis family transcriptional regulator, partial [Candidatus Lindowbacteria bacterium]|nr:sigma-54-dependent Fis family transcriptional regulator [Candidatus Lindowbacteria bacterium]